MRIQEWESRAEGVWDVFRVVRWSAECGGMCFAFRNRFQPTTVFLKEICSDAVTDCAGNKNTIYG